MRKAFLNFPVFAGFILGLALSANVVSAQSPPNPAGPLNNPKEDMVIPKPPSEGATGELSAKDIPGASRQTAPSTVSAANADMDKHWWLDRGIGLTPEQKTTILSLISTKLDTEGASKIKIHGVVSEILPGDFATQSLPGELTSKIPSLRDLTYVKANNQVLLVNPGNNTVAAVISK